MPPKKKIKLDNRKNEKSRELAKARFKRYRENIKKDPERLKIQKEKAKIRSKLQVEREKKNRENSTAYNEVQLEIWRSQYDKRKSTRQSNMLNACTVENWNEFQKQPGPSNVSLAQKKRRRKERQAQALHVSKLENDNKDLKRKVNALRKSIARKDKLVPKEKNITSRPVVMEETRTENAQLTVTTAIWKYRAKKFFHRDDISRVLVGQTIIDKSSHTKNRRKYCWRGKRITKRVLLFKLSDTYDKFCKAYPKFNHKLKTFSKWRPVNIVTAMKGAKRAKCVCIYHSNVNRKLTALNRLSRKKGLDHLVISTTDQLTNLTLCQGNSEDVVEHKAECIKRECSSCGPEVLLDYYEKLKSYDDEQEVVNWTRWEKIERDKMDKRTGIMTKKAYQEVVNKSGFIQDLLEETISELNPFSTHIFRAKWQWTQLRNIQLNLPHSEAIFIADFSENLAIQFAEETIASHAKASSVTLFVAAVYRHDHRSTEDKPRMLFENINIMSDTNQHDSHFVHACTKLILDHCTQYKEKEVLKWHRYTDGCAGQFRSRHTLRDLSFVGEDFGIKMIANFGETSEFKNVTDGLGGVVKRLITDHILSDNNLILSCAKDVVDFAKKRFQFDRPNVDNGLDNFGGEMRLNRRVFYFLEDAEVDRNRPERLGRLVAGIQNVRCIKSIQPGFVAFRNISCYCKPCIHGNGADCENKRYVDEWSSQHTKSER